MRLSTNLSYNNFAFWFFSAIAAVTLILMVPNLFKVLLFATLGLAVYLLYLPTLWAYAICLVPLGFRYKQQLRWHSFAISIALLAALAFLPHIFASWELENLNSGEKNVQVAETTNVRSLSVEVDPNRKNPFSMTGTYCGYECSSLLKNRQLDWVRLTTDKSYSGSSIGNVIYGDNRKEGQQILKLISASGQICTNFGLTNDERSTCILPKQNDNLPADLNLKISFLGEDTPDPKNHTRGWAHVNKLTSVMAFNHENTLIYKRADIKAHIPVWPTVLLIKMEGMNSGGLFIQRKPIELGASINLLNLFADMGFRISSTDVSTEEKGELENENSLGLPQELNRKLFLALEDKKVGRFNDRENFAINQWVEMVSNRKSLTPKHIELATKIIDDKRWRKGRSVDQFFDINDDVSAALLPAVFNRIRSDVDRSSDNIYRNFVRHKLGKLDVTMLQPYVEIIKELSTQKGNYGLPAIGRIGIDPAPYLFPLGKFVDPEWQIIGACQSEKKWLPSIAEAWLKLTIDRRHFNDLAEEELGNSMANEGKYELAVSTLPIFKKTIEKAKIDCPLFVLK